jgi:hypothetical protein
VELLLKSGADPKLKTKEAEGPYDVAKDDETREMIESFPEEETLRLLEKRKAYLKQKLEERITTQAEREVYQRAEIKQELIALTIAGDCEGLKEKLVELAASAEKHSERPRGTAEARDERGCTLLALAAQHGKLDIAKMLLTHWKEVDADDMFLNKEMGEMSMEAKVFKSNVNCRDSKGWNPCAIATFHDNRQMLELLIEAGGDPSVKNSYHKSAIDLAQPELDAAENVMKSHEEVLTVLTEWEMQHGRAKKDLSGQLVAGELKAKDGSAVMLQVEVAAEGGVNGGAKKKKGGAGAKKGGGAKKGAKKMAAVGKFAAGKKKGK